MKDNPTKVSEKMNHPVHNDSLFVHLVDCPCYVLADGVQYLEVDHDRWCLNLDLEEGLSYSGDLVP